MEQKRSNLGFYCDCVSLRELIALMESMSFFSAAERLLTDERIGSAHRYPQDTLGDDERMEEDIPRPAERNGDKASIPPLR